MNKLSLALISLMCLAGCRGDPQPITPFEGDFRVGVVDDGVQPVTSSEFVAWVGSGSVFTSAYNELDAEEVLSLNGTSGKTIPTLMVNDQGLLRVVDDKKIVWTVAWRDGVWQTHLKTVAITTWVVRYNLAVKHGKVIGTVGEVNHGQDEIEVPTECDGN